MGFSVSGLEFDGLFSYPHYHFQRPNIPVVVTKPNWSVILKQKCTGRDNMNMKDSLREDNNKKVRDSWDNNKNCFGGDYLGGFTWPPRSYTCSFCRREFRSAQALGGHMNVHRRERARLRQSPPWNATSASSNEVKKSMGSPSDPSSVIGGDISNTKTMKALFSVEELKGFVQEDECRVLKKAKVVRTNLEIGLCTDSKEDLDLELRLGYS